MTGFSGPLTAISSSMTGFWSSLISIRITRDQNSVNDAVGTCGRWLISSHSLIRRTCRATTRDGGPPSAHAVAPHMPVWENSARRTTCPLRAPAGGVPWPRGHADDRSQDTAPDLRRLAPFHLAPGSAATAGADDRTLPVAAGIAATRATANDLLRWDGRSGTGHLAPIPPAGTYNAGRRSACKGLTRFLLRTLFTALRDAHAAERL